MIKESDSWGRKCEKGQGAGASMRASRIKGRDVLRISGKKVRFGTARTLQSVLLQRESCVLLRLGAVEKHVIKTASNQKISGRSSNLKRPIHSQLNWAICLCDRNTV